MSKQKVTNMETSIEYGLECHTHTHITVLGQDKSLIFTI